MRPVYPAACFGGPFCGRVISGLGMTMVYQGRNTGAVALGIPFVGGSLLGCYEPDKSNPARMVWRPTGMVDKAIGDSARD